MKGVEEEGGIAEAIGSSVSTCGLQLKLGLAPPNRTSADGTYGGEERRVRNGDMKVCEDMCNSRRKDELITCSRIQIHI